MTAFHHTFEDDRHDDDVERRRFAKTGRDLDVVGGHVGEKNLSLLQRALTDQALAHLVSVIDVLAFLVGVAGQQP